MDLSDINRVYTRASFTILKERISKQHLRAAKSLATSLSSSWELLCTDAISTLVVNTR